MSYVMAANSRTDPCRFSVGMHVEIRDVIATPFAGKTGTVVRITSSRYNYTLDKYVVQFPPGVEAEFWDIQLRKVQVAA